MGFSNAAGIFSAVFVLAGLISAIHAWRSGDLLDRRTSIQFIRSVSWKDLEYLVGEAFRRQGYAVKENAAAGAGGGVDLVFEKDGRRTLVQCKNWQSRSVSHDHHGHCVLWLDKRSRARLGREQGQQVLRDLEKHLNAYVVTDSGGTVVTVGHRYRRIMRH